VALAVGVELVYRRFRGARFQLDGGAGEG
jgi:hypothetical protein